MTGSYFHKKILIFGVLLSFIFGTFLPIQTAFAQPTSAGLQQQTDSGQMKKAGEKANPPSSTGTPTGNDGSNESIYCIKATGVTDAWIPEIDLAGCIANVTYLILQASSWVLWVSAILFNVTINYTLNMASFIKDVPIVSIGWTTFRDIANIFFVFLVLYIAINTIVGNEGYGIKKLLGKVIVAAMFINFSLFFTQAMIDASNIFALQFYNSITQGTSGQTTKGSSLDKIDSGISAAFVNAMGFQQILYNGSGGSSSGAGIAVDSKGSLNSGGKTLKLNAYNLITVSLGGTVLIIVTAFVFFAATLMFITRAVTLMFLMILSPLAFLGSVLPALGEVTKKWWSQLFNNLLFAPAYMALLYLVIGMITSGKFSGVGGKSSFYELFSGNGNVVGVILTFLVLNALMIGCLLIASSLSIKGADGWVKQGKGLATSLGMTLSGAGFATGVARTATGIVGTRLSESKILANTAAHVPIIGRAAGALMYRGKKLKDEKIGGKSYNEEIKEKEKYYTDTGELIEKQAGEKAEKKFLTASILRTHTTKQAMSRAKKKAGKTNNKQELEHLLGYDGKQIMGRQDHGVYSEKNMKNARQEVEKIKNEIANQRVVIKNATPADAVGHQAKLAALIDERTEYQKVIDGYSRSIEKLNDIESK